MNDQTAAAAASAAAASMPVAAFVPAPLPETDAALALRTYGSEIAAQEGVLNIAVGFYKDAEARIVQCLQVHTVKDASIVDGLRAKYTPLTVAEGRTVQLHIIPTGENFLRSGPGNAALGIHNEVNLHGTGSIACLVYDVEGNACLLTCYHVANGDASWGGVQTKMNILNEHNECIAKSYVKSLNQFHDTAIITLEPAFIAYYKNIFRHNPTQIRDIVPGDIYVKDVFMNGYKTGIASGTIVHDSWPEKFMYGSYQNEMIDLLQIQNLDTGRRIADFSDSGALLCDEYGAAVGMVIGGNDICTYAIKIRHIIDDFGLSLT